jgi:AcrR family transcriptional regulator
MSTPQVRGQARAAILHEALHLFASRGVEAVSVRDIAAATGYSNPALFRHFPSKDALAEALFADRYSALLAAIATADTLHELLEAALVEINRLPEGVLFVLDNLKRYWATLPDDLKKRNLPKVAIAMIERLQRAGRIRSDVSPRLVATLLFGALGQIARSVHFKETEIDPPALARELADLIEHGVGPAGPERRRKNGERK